MFATILNLVSGPGLIILLVGVIFFFGGKRIPALAHSIRKSFDQFRRGKDEGLPDESSRPGKSNSGAPPIDRNRPR